MSAPVTHEEVSLVLGVVFGGGALMVGLFTLADALGDITPSQRQGEIGCGFWLCVIGVVMLILTGIGWLV